MADRHFPNPYTEHPACFSSTKEKAREPPQIPPELSLRLRESVEITLTQCDSAYRHAPSSDTSVYTGTAGIALLHLHLATTLHSEDQRKRRHHLLQAQFLLKPCLSHLPRHGVTFLCGSGGPLAIAAVVEAGLGNTDTARGLLDQLKEIYASDRKGFSQMPSELLYGHVGYLYCLLFVNAYLPGAFSQELLDEVVGVAMGAGERGRESSIPCPLMYTWHGRHYLGAAHGLAGIMTLLLQAGSKSSNLTATVKFLADLQMPSGNFPSSLESLHDDSRHSDQLVHWCHGAPGFIHLMSHAYQVLGEGQYLAAGERCGAVVWERGLLRKGYGLCHGTAGNAYTFLQLHHLTGQPHHWQRAVKFAEWCLSCDERVTCTPDRPLSLFEGAAGVTFFYCDIIMMSLRGRAPFPGLEIPQPKITFSIPTN